jgi:hypothetical protein
MRTWHIMAVVQLCHRRTQGRVYFDARKAAGKTSMEAMRALKRRLSNVVYTRMVADQNRRQAAGPGGHSGTTLQSSVTDLTPDVGSSDKPLPGPAPQTLPASRPTENPRGPGTAAPSLAAARPRRQRAAPHRTNDVDTDQRRRTMRRLPGPST